jgi:hypothetical protein
MEKVCFTYPLQAEREKMCETIREFVSRMVFSVCVWGTREVEISGCFGITVTLKRLTDRKLSVDER